METISRYFNPSEQSFFLFGPRGTGKSTYVKSAYQDAVYLDLLDPETSRSLSARPERLKERLEAEGGSKVVVIDEIQRVPQLLSLVHLLIEEKRGWRFVLTGSSSRKLKRTGVDLLAGRAVMHHMHPFMASELGDAFSIASALRYGLLPVVLDSSDAEGTLRAYAGLYVRDEVQQEGLVRRVGDFTRFLEAATFSHAAQLNISNVARECEVQRKVVENYIGIFEDLLLGYRLNVFTRKAKRELVSHPKLFFVDAGVYRSLRPKGPLDKGAELEGPALEGLVAQHLRAWIDYSGYDASLSYWRTKGGSEVDFVVYGDCGFFAIEVKNSTRVHRTDLRSLHSFKNDYPQSQVYLLYRGQEEVLIDDVPCIPVDRFLRSLTPGKWFR